MSNHPEPSCEQWARKWLSSVAEGRSTMSQRRLSAIERHAGSLGMVMAVAKELNVHLLQLEDDKGKTLVAASKGEFKVLT